MVKISTHIAFLSSFTFHPHGITFFQPCEDIAGYHTILMYLELIDQYAMLYTGEVIPFAATVSTEYRVFILPCNYFLNYSLSRKCCKWNTVRFEVDYGWLPINYWNKFRGVGTIQGQKELIYWLAKLSPRIRKIKNNF